MCSYRAKGIIRTIYMNEPDCINLLFDIILESIDRVRIMV